jgi:hypothetical protein
MISLAAFLIVFGSTLSAIRQIFLKIGANLPRKFNTLTTLWLTLITPGAIAGLGLYAARFGRALWLKLNFSQAYPFVGIGFMLTTLAGSRSLRSAIRGNAARCCAHVIQSMEVP